MIKKYFFYLYTIIKLIYHGVKFHYRVLGNGFYIENKGTIKLGWKAYLHSYPNGSCHRTVLITYFPESIIEIGLKCALNGVTIHCNEKVLIGDYCMFGPGTILCDNNSHRVSINYNERIKKAVSAPIIIEDNVWVGMNCLVMKGVTIGKNSIVAAGSVVLKDIPANCLYGGNPARLIKALTE
jgi:acetyltransferase-like isoleucine patch superfamily enzyme